MTAFSPVAVVGRSCVLPGALSYTDFWNALIEQRDLLSRLPAGYWRVAPEEVLCRPEDWTEGKIWSDRGGYVRGFEGIFDPTGFARSADDIRKLDVQIHWLLHTARQVLEQLGLYKGGHPLRERTALIFGNLGYPTFAFNAYAESLWMQRLEQAPDPRNRFHPGFSGHYAAECLGVTGEAWCLDAACASSLYALKLACDRLHDGEADVVLAGAVNRCDGLMIHAGFCSLRALSATGQSRPFHQQADGLVPAEGAAIVGLMRLEDALARDVKILGVIRAVGLSNDGREGGFLSPSAAGQTRALEQAYSLSGLDPGEIAYVECHATGTPGGDRTELEMLASFFRDGPGVRIGSHKSNMGHLITAAGAAGLLKILSSFEHGLLAPDRCPEALVPLAKTHPLSVVMRAETWQTSAPRRAGLNAFGFGGTNAHLIVEEWREQTRHAMPHARASDAGDSERIRIAVVGIALRSGRAADIRAFARLLFGTDSNLRSAAIDTIPVDLRELSFPPHDLEDTLPQQILMLETALDAARTCVLLPSETGVFVGAGCDPETCRWTASTRLADLYPDTLGADATRTECHSAACVVGAMMNIVANRINFQLGLLGPGFTCFAEELSGTRALDTAVRMISRGELKSAIVGAVDLSVDKIHAAAAQQVLPENREPPGDAAVALVLKALDDADQDGDTIFAVLDDDDTGQQQDTSPVLHLSLDEQRSGVTPLVGHAHAASGLLLVASGALALHHRLLPTLEERPAWPWLGFRASRRATIEATALGGQSATVRLREAHPEADSVPDVYLSEHPKIYSFSGESREDILRQLDGERGPSKAGPLRLAFVAGDDEFETVKRRAADRLREVARPSVLSEAGYFFATIRSAAESPCFAAPLPASTRDKERTRIARSMTSSTPIDPKKSRALAPPARIPGGRTPSICTARRDLPTGWPGHGSYPVCTD